MGSLSSPQFTNEFVSFYSSELSINSVLLFVSVLRSVCMTGADSMNGFLCLKSDTYDR